MFRPRGVDLKVGFTRPNCEAIIGASILTVNAETWQEGIGSQPSDEVEAMSAVVITDAGDLLQPALETLEAAGIDVRVLPVGISGAEAAELAGEARVLVVGLLPFGRDAIKRLQRVELIIRCGVGVDIIDVDAATERGILVANVPDYCSDEVADHAMMLMLACARALPAWQEALPTHGWRIPARPEVRRLNGLTVGIVGLGRIGSRVARRAGGFTPSVVAHDPYVDRSAFEEAGARRVQLAELLTTSEVITLHCPLTDETHHLLDSHAFASMRRGVIIVNTSRGAVVDISALEAALDRGVVWAAGFDVLEGEPDIDPAHPLLARSNVIVTPHIAWYSQEAQRDLGTLAAQDALRFLRGERPRSLVNPDAWALRGARR